MRFIATARSDLGYLQATVLQQSHGRFKPDLAQTLAERSRIVRQSALQGTRALVKRACYFVKCPAGVRSLGHQSAHALSPAQLLGRGEYETALRQ